MYDEIVKRLNVFRLKVDEYQIIPVYVSEIIGQAADAIEELSRSEAVALANCADEHNRRLTLEQKHRWIPVEERLPEDIDEEVLVCTEDYGVSGLGFVTVATYGDSGWLECWTRKTYISAVTHWMPLPQPPKEEA